MYMYEGVGILRLIPTLFLFMSNIVLLIGETDAVTCKLQVKKLQRVLSDISDRQGCVSSRFSAGTSHN